MANPILALRQLFIPHKESRALVKSHDGKTSHTVVKQPDYSNDMRAIETWAQNIQQQISQSTGGYASLTGPGQTVTPGALTQQGNFTVDGEFTANTGTNGAFINATGAGQIALTYGTPNGSFAVVTGSQSVFFADGHGNVTMGQTSNPQIRITSTSLTIDQAGSHPINIGTGTGGNVTIRAAAFVVTIGGTVNMIEAGPTAILGFYGASPVPQAAHPVTLGDVITILTNLGLCA